MRGLQKRGRTDHSIVPGRGKGHKVRGGAQETTRWGGSSHSDRARQSKPSAATEDDDDQANDKNGGHDSEENSENASDDEVGVRIERIGRDRGRTNGVKRDGAGCKK